MKTNYHRKIKVNQNATLINFGKAEEIERDDGVEVIPEKTIDEFTFYYLLCSINNVTAKFKLANTQLIVLSAIMCKPLDFSLPVDSKDGKLTKIAEELSEMEGEKRTANSIYQSVKRLRDAGYLVETEDKLIVPSAQLQRVRYIVKREIEKNGFACFDYIFKCYITKDGQDNREDN